MFVGYVAPRQHTCQSPNERHPAPVSLTMELNQRDSGSSFNYSETGSELYPVEMLIARTDVLGSQDDATRQIPEIGYIFCDHPLLTRRQ